MAQSPGQTDIAQKLRGLDLGKDVGERISPTKKLLIVFVNND
jgi:hypothetical protein